MSEIIIPASRLAETELGPCVRCMAEDSVGHEGAIVYWYKGQVVDAITDMAKCLDCNRMYAFTEGEWK